MQSEAGLTKPTAAHRFDGPVVAREREPVTALAPHPSPLPRERELVAMDRPLVCWGGEHATDGLRARAATGLGCMQSGTKKLGVLGASY